MEMLKITDTNLDKDRGYTNCIDIISRDVLNFTSGRL